MSIELPNARNIFVPMVPKGIDDILILGYFSKLKNSIEEGYMKAFDNAKVITDVLNTGTSGTFISSAGATITVTNGIITALA